MFYNDVSVNILHIYSIMYNLVSNVCMTIFKYVDTTFKHRL